MDHLVDVKDETSDNLNFTVNKALRNVRSHPNFILRKADAFSVNGVGNGLQRDWKCKFLTTLLYMNTCTLIIQRA